MRSLLPLLVTLVVLTRAFAADAPKPWERWDGCVLAADRYFDGDSFQIRHAGKLHVLRLYGADTPETDTSYGTRVTGQAAYFGISDAEVLRGAAKAKEFTGAFLGKPFSVITRWKTAPGASRAQRYYAVIERDGTRLDAALIAAGLARATGETADFPDAAAGHTRQQELRALEQKAAQDRVGLWAESKRTDRRPSLKENVTARLRSFIGKPAAAPAPRKVNLNTAAKSDLEALPGIGPKTADQIIRARPLKDFDALDAVHGIGPKKIEALRDLVSF